jgi:hypothetical protein
MSSTRDQTHAPTGRAVSLWVLLCLPTLAVGEVPLDPLIACTQLTADVPRLACFDREIAKVRTGATGTPNSSEPVPTPEQTFGLSGAQARAAAHMPAQEAVSALHAQIVNISQNANGRLIFVLDNSQTWQQIELEPDFPARTGQSVTISNGALGSFWLSSNPRRATRVKRIR